MKNRQNNDFWFFKIKKVISNFPYLQTPPDSGGVCLF